MTAPTETVFWNDLHPAEFGRRLAEAPIAYLPLGSLEWHSHHMPYGVDTYKAEAVAALAAQRYGGIVVPGSPWGAMHGSWRTGTHPGLSQPVLEAFYTEVLEGMVEVGFRVIVAISGHWTSRQTGPVRTALECVARAGEVTGFVTFDGADPYDGFPADPDLEMDHAGVYETSIFAHLRPELVRLERLDGVNMSDLPGEECHLTASGIQGADPSRATDPERGRRHVERVVTLIGERARELLATVAPLTQGVSRQR
jgi:creatinine amidohydrolase